MVFEFVLEIACADDGFQGVKEESRLFSIKLAMRVRVRPKCANILFISESGSCDFIDIYFRHVQVH